MSRNLQHFQALHSDLNKGLAETMLHNNKNVKMVFTEVIITDSLVTRESAIKAHHTFYLRRRTASDLGKLATRLFFVYYFNRSRKASY